MYTRPPRLQKIVKYKDSFRILEGRMGGRRRRRENGVPDGFNARVEIICGGESELSQVDGQWTTF